MSCLVCDVPTEGVWGPSGPSGLQGGALLLFSGMGSRERSGRDPMPVLPNPNPMDEVHGGYFYSFCRRSCVLPMLSLFHIGRPCGERESFQIRNLGSYLFLYEPSYFASRWIASGCDSGRSIAESRGGYFYSFCRRSCVLPMLSLFHICRPCGERESFQIRNLGSYLFLYEPSYFASRWIASGCDSGRSIAESRGGYFYSFCRRSCVLPMLSLFHICRPCGERESFQIRNLGSYLFLYEPSYFASRWIASGCDSGRSIAESRGGYFYSFCRRSCVLPMLSLFHIGRPCGERESFQIRNLGSYLFLYEPSYFASRWIASGCDSGRSIAESRGG